MRSFALVILLTIPSLALSWGNEGHRAVGEIAWHYLNPSAKAGVRELLEPGRYYTLAETATWPDTYARGNPNYRWVEPFHYINIDRDAASVVVNGRNCRRNACVVGGIREFARQLQDEEVPRWKRVNALRFLSHFVGDVHQPLHVAHFDGRGGTRTFPEYDGSDSRHIHKLWDTILIREYIRTYERPSDGWEPDRSETLWEDFAYDLRMSITPDDAADWAGTLDPKAWANESLVIAKRELFSYDDGDRLPDDYIDDAVRIISEQIQKAGVRLAAILNVVFLGEELPF